MQYIQLQGQSAPEMDVPLEGSYNLFIDGADGTIKLIDDEGNWYGDAALISTTYSALRTLQNSSSLRPGTYYLITNFKNCYDQPDYDLNRDPIITGNYKEDAEVTPIIVFATSADTLAAEAFQPAYPKDKIKYDISFNETEVTNTPARGRITERIDEWGNRTDYDHRAILFRRYVNYVYRENDEADGTIEIVLNTGEVNGEVIGTDTSFTSYSVDDVIAVPSSSERFFRIVSIDSDTRMTVAGESVSVVAPGATFYLAQQRGLTYFQNNISTEYTEHPTFLFEDETIIGNYFGDVATFQDWDGLDFLLPNNVFGEDVIGNRIGNTFRNNTFNSDVEENVIGDDFYNNTIYNDEDFANNQIGSNFSNNLLIVDDINGNIIGEGFSDNMIFGNSDFFDNVIGSNFYSNTIYDDFEDNQIGNDFYDNIIEGFFAHNSISNEFENNIISGEFSYNQIQNRFKGNTLGNLFKENRIANGFIANQIEENFMSNSIGNDFFINDIGNDFQSNSIMDDFTSNQIGNNFRYNRIGTYFYNNEIDDDFGFGGGAYRGNVIGNNFTDNTIGEYFYDNNVGDNFTNCTVGEYFQFNRIETGLNGIDFTTELGKLFSVSYATGITGTDGVYTDIAPISTSGIGTGARFTITVSGGVITDIQITTAGKMYQIGDTITIFPSSFGGASDLILDVDDISATPMVYGNYNKTIQRNFDGTTVLVAMSNSGLYWSQFITEPID